MTKNPELRFKRGETVEITVLFDILDDYGISSLTGVTAVAQLRRKHGGDTVADFDVSVYPETPRVLLTLTAGVCAALDAGQYVTDVMFTRLSDGLTQYSGDIAVNIIKSTSHAD
ncbi:hypothetical protein ACFPVS_08935 [Neisseria weixii]|uniref:hypothetical protein n=1 Tax=Neisseria weixii TaxID=1853276 RepID=UPI000BB697E8|nr:hypothetical protein [Neisseria weixii]ATD64120.1 hypothetical protein CGZ65_00045 [Neisseria weixii]ATD65872.1 hypothetical protein CGZ65_12545 [Neisseria weixii]